MSVPAVQETASQWDSREMVETIKQTVCKGATDAQLKMFIEVAKATGLNPFLKEIWFVPNVGVMAGRDGYLRIANDHPMFDGMETRVERDAEGIPIKATCSVWRKDRAHPITCEAFYNEYKKNSQVWTTYKSAMISKVAEVLALKRSFSINGIVTEEEIGEQKLSAADAQREVADRKITELKAIPAGSTVSPAQIAEVEPVTADEVEQAILNGTTVRDYEERSRVRAEEGQVFIGTAAAPANNRIRGDISFEALKNFKEMKRMLRDASDGTDKLYYEALAAAGVEHADALSTVEGRKVYKAMLAIHSRLKQDAALRLEIEAHEKRVGPHAFDYTLRAHGLQSVEDVLAMPDATALQAFLNELREIVV